MILNIKPSSIRCLEIYSSLEPRITSLSRQVAWATVAAASSAIWKIRFIHSAAATHVNVEPKIFTLLSIDIASKNREKIVLQVDFERILPFLLFYPKQNETLAEMFTQFLPRINNLQRKNNHRIIRNETFFSLVFLLRRHQTSDLKR